MFNPAVQYSGSVSAKMASVQSIIPCFALNCRSSIDSIRGRRGGACHFSFCRFSFCRCFCCPSFRCASCRCCASWRRSSASWCGCCLTNCAHSSRNVSGVSDSPTFFNHCFHCCHCASCCCRCASFLCCAFGSCCFKRAMIQSIGR